MYDKEKKAIFSKKTNLVSVGRAAVLDHEASAAASHNVSERIWLIVQEQLP